MPQATLNFIHIILLHLQVNVESNRVIYVNYFTLNLALYVSVISEVNLRSVRAFFYILVLKLI